MARSPTYSETVLLDQPNGYWRLTSAATVTDSAGNVAVGTAFACTSTTGLLQGDADTALAFNGSSSKANIPTSATVHSSSSLTLEAWVAPSQVSGTSTVFQNSNEYALNVVGSAFVGVTVASGVAVQFPFGPTLSPGSAYHVVYAIDGYSVYGCVNGATYSYGVSPVGYTPITANSSGFTVGAGSGFFKGTIDEVAFYDYKLSEQQAFAHYIAGSNASPSASTAVVEVAFLANAVEDYYQQVTDDGPIAFYRLNETSGTSFANWESVSLNGTVIPPLTGHGTFTVNQTAAIPNDSSDHAVAFKGTAGSYANASTFTDTIGGFSAYSAGFTIECWLKAATPPSTQSWLAGFSGGAQVLVQTGSTGKIVTTGGLVSSVNVCDGSYHHVAFTYAGSSSTISLYIDGDLNQTVGGFTPATSGSAWQVAGSNTTQNFGGTVDEVAFYRSCLSTDRIGVHYAARNNPRPIVWTDISPYVRGYTVSQGRQHELDRYEAATLSVTVNNDDRRFEADYNASPYYPNVLPYRRVRVWESKDGVRFPIFNGWIERWPQSWTDQSYHSEVQIQAVDGFDLMNAAAIDPTGLSGSSPQSTEGFVVSYLDQFGNWDATEYPIVRSFNAGVQSNNPTDTNVLLLSIAQAYEVTEDGEFYIDRFGRPTFLARNARTGSAILATFGDIPSEIPYRTVVPSLDRDNILNDVTVTRSGGTAQQVVDYDSIAAYGRRSTSISTLNSTDAGALSTAQAILATHKTAARRIESIDLLYADGGHNGLLVQLLTRKIGDRIIVRRRPDKTNLSSILEEECLISHVAITRQPKQIAATWQLVPPMVDTGSLDTGPVVITMQPVTATDGATNIEALVDVSVTATSVQFQVDGVNYASAETTAYTGTTYRTLLDLDTLTVGAHTIQAVLTKTDTTQSTSAPIIVTVARASIAAAPAGLGWYRGRSPSSYTTDSAWLNRTIKTPNIHIGGIAGTSWATIKSDASSQGTAWTAGTFGADTIMFTPNMLPYDGSSATCPDGADKTITGASNATPISITATAHGYSTGNIITITGVLGNTAANGAWAITSTGANTFTLNTSVGNGAYTSGGTATSRSSMTAGAAGFYTSTGTGGTNHWLSIANSLVAAGWGVSGKTCIIRPGHECTGNWFPWNVRSVGSGGTGAEYASYFQKVVTVFRSVMTDVKFEYNGNAYQPNSTSAPATFAGAYPGDANVDYIGLDVYDNSGLSTFADRWSAARGGLTFGSFAGGLGLDYLVQFAALHHKPVSLSEWGLNPSVQTEDWQWTEAMCQWIKANNVGLHVYYNGGTQDIVNASGPISAMRKSALIVKREFGQTWTQPTSIYVGELAAFNTKTGSGTTQAIPLTYAPAAGNRVVLMFGFRLTTTGVTITDSKSNVWTTDVAFNGSNNLMVVAHTDQGVGTLTTSDTITVSGLDTLEPQRAALVEEFTNDGILGTSGNATSASATSGSSGTATGALAGDMVLVAYCISGPETITNDVAFYAFGTEQVGGDAATHPKLLVGGYQRLVAAADVAATYSWNTAQSYQAVIVAFRP